MGYAEELYFDKISEETIRDMWKALYDKDISKYMYESNSRPHITLAVYDENINDFDLFVKSIKDFVKETVVFKLNLSNIGMFNTEEGIVFIQPKVTYQLLHLYVNGYKLHSVQ
jgi:hypothetical protein